MMLRTTNIKNRVVWQTCGDMSENYTAFSIHVSQ